MQDPTEPCDVDRVGEILNSIDPGSALRPYTLSRVVAEWSLASLTNALGEWRTALLFPFLRACETTGGAYPDESERVLEFMVRAKKHMSGHRCIRALEIQLAAAAAVYRCNTYH